MHRSIYSITSSAAGEERGRHGETERLRGPKIDTHDILRRAARLEFPQDARP